VSRDDDDLLAPLRAERLPKPRGDESGRFVVEVMRQVALRPAPVRRRARRTVAWRSFGSLVVGGAVAAFVLLHRTSVHAPQPVAVAPPAASDGLVRVRLTLRAPEARNVAVAGELNGWQPAACERAADGTWTIELTVRPGRYRYSFVVDGTFIGDPAAALVADDDFGGRDAVLVV
jgi:hypothetical protein